MLPLRAQICLRVGMDDKFIIPLNGLATGRNEYFWKVGKEFFESFENTEILGAEIDVRVSVEKSGRYVGVDCDVEGDVVVECDRCLDEVVMPVDTQRFLSVKYGSEEESEEPREGEREVVMVPDTDSGLDMSQIIYDYVCLALPMQRIHEDGGCNPEAMKRLAVGNDEDTAEVGADNPFAALKELIK